VVPRQRVGIASHVPGLPVTPQFAVMGKSQYSPAWQGDVPRAPQTRGALASVPVSDALPPST